MITIGTFNIKSMSIGIFSIKSIWIGNTKVWSAEDATALADMIPMSAHNEISSRYRTGGGMTNTPLFYIKKNIYEEFANCFIDYMDCPRNP